MAYDETYNKGTMAADRKPIVLPGGVEHGSAHAAMRSGCTCEKCNEKRARIRERGWRR